MWEGYRTSILLPTGVSAEIRTGNLPYRVRISTASLGYLQLISWIQNPLKRLLARYEHVTIAVTGLRKTGTVY
jgi:hypothetical protein